MSARPVCFSRSFNSPQRLSCCGGYETGSRNPAPRATELGTRNKRRGASRLVRAVVESCAVFALCGSVSGHERPRLLFGPTHDAGVPFRVAFDTDGGAITQWLCGMLAWSYVRTRID